MMYKFSICLLLSLFVLNSVDAKEKRIITSKIEVSNFKLDILINGFPYQDITVKESQTSMGRVNSYIKESNNVIEISTIPLNKEEKGLVVFKVFEKVIDVKTRAVIKTRKIIEYEIKYQTKGGKFLFVDTISGDGKIVKSSASSGLNKSKLDFNLKTWPIKKLPWQNNVKIDITKEQKEIFKQVLELNKAFVDKQVDKASKFLQTKMSYYAKSMFSESSKFDLKQKKFFESMFKSENFKIEALTTEMLEVKSFGSSLNLIKVCRKDDSAPIKINFSDMKYSLPIYMSKINGKWDIVK